MLWNLPAGCRVNSLLTNIIATLSLVLVSMTMLYPLQAMRKSWTSFGRPRWETGNFCGHCSASTRAFFFFGSNVVSSWILCVFPCRYFTNELLPNHFLYRIKIYLCRHHHPSQSSSLCRAAMCLILPLAWSSKQRSLSASSLVCQPPHKWNVLWSFLTKVITWWNL